MSDTRRPTRLSQEDFNALVSRIKTELRDEFTILFAKFAWRALLAILGTAGGAHFLWNVIETALKK